MNNFSNLALLAPVPARHLQSSLEVCQREGKVAFGSNAFEVFSKLDIEHAGQPVPVYFYASHEEDVKLVISWQGIYTGYRNREGIPYSERNRFRPPTTYQPPQPDTDDWGIYWEVTDLAEIPEGSGHLPLSKIFAYKSRKGINYIPRGPVLINNPGV